MHRDKIQISKNTHTHKFKVDRNLAVVYFPFLYSPYDVLFNATSSKVTSQVITHYWQTKAIYNKYWTLDLGPSYTKCLPLRFNSFPLCNLQRADGKIIVPRRSHRCLAYIRPCTALMTDLFVFDWYCSFSPCYFR